LIPESESVLQGKTGSDTDVSGAALVGEFLSEGNKVGSLSDNSGISVQIQDWVVQRGPEGIRETYEVDLGGVCELLFGISTLGRIWREGALQHLTGVHGVQRKGCGGWRKKRGKKKSRRRLEKRLKTPLSLDQSTF
jgi:hypothetical protein